MFNTVFISHAKEDSKTAENLYDFLISNSYDPWLDKKKLHPGENWEIEIMSALKKSDYIILLFSKTSVTKRSFIQREYSYALKYCEEKLDTDIFIIPCIIDDCEIPEKFRKFQWIELTDPDSFERILGALNKQRKKVIEAEKKDHDKIVSEIDLIKDDREEKLSVIGTHVLRAMGEGQAKKLIEIIFANDNTDDTIQKILNNFNTEQLNEEENLSEEQKETPGKYEILQNGKGKILILIKARQGGPDNPRIVYDGGSEALLYRSRESSLMLKEISQEARKPLSSADEVLVVETDGDEVHREYVVPMRIVRDLEALMK